MLAVNRRNRESCPRGKGTTPTKRRSVEEGRKRTWDVATAGWPENRGWWFTVENISDKLLRYIEAQ